MKRRIQLFIVSFSLLIGLVACGQGTEKVKEYKIEDLIEIVNIVREEYESETLYFTDDEKEEKGTEIFKEILKRHNLKPNIPIEVSGCFNTGVIVTSEFFWITKKQEDPDKYSDFSDDLIVCRGVKSNNYLLLNNGDNIRVKGILFSDGIDHFSITDAEILSPDLNDADKFFENNIDDLMTKEETGFQNTIRGTIGAVINAKDIDAIVSAYEYYTNHDIKTAANYNDFVEACNGDAKYYVLVYGENYVCSLLVKASDEEQYESLEEGKRIAAFSSSVYFSFHKDRLWFFETSNWIVFD